MKTFAVPPAGRDGLEKLATSILAGFDPEALAVAKPLDVEKLLDVYMWQAYQWDVDVQESLPPRIEAYSDPKVRRVVLPASAYEILGSDGRARFTACHEFSHVAKHRKVMENRMYAFDEKEELAFRSLRGELRPYECAEWQANYLAGALLMPEKHVLNVYKMSGGCRDAAALAIAKMFIVSYPAAKCRLDQILKKRAAK